MSLRLIYGRAGSGKSYYCLDDIKMKLDYASESPLIMIVPEQFSFQSEKNLIKKVGDRGTEKAEVLSFRRMAYRVLGEVGGLTRKNINPAGKCMLLHSILEKSKKDLKVFARAINQHGFINTLSDVIAEFKRYDISFLDLENTIDNIIDNDILKDKLREISTLYGEYENRLHEKYIEPDDYLMELYKKLDYSQQFDGGEFWIDEFSGFTPQEYKVIEKLLLKAKRVNICLCTDYLSVEGNPPELDLFSPITNTAQKLTQLAQNNGISIEKPLGIKKAGDNLHRFIESNEIQHIESNFFAFPYKKYNECNKDVSIFTASNIYSEIEEIARDITKLCMNEGLKYRDIAVVSRNLAGYEKMISVIFDEHNIPCFIDSSRNINNNPLVQVILLALEIFINNWSYDSVFRYLKTGLANIDRDSVDIIENYVLACGIKGRGWTSGEPWKFRLDPLYDKTKINHQEDERLKLINNIREEIIKPLLELRSKIKGRKTVREICTCLYEFLCDLQIPEYIEKSIDDFRISGELDRAEEYRQVWNAVMSVIDQLVEVAGDEVTGIEKFSKILETGFQGQKIALIPPALDQVLVGSIERSKNHEIKALYIFGVNDGVFPAAITHEGILSDKDRHVLGDYGIELAQDSRGRSLQEQYLIYTSLTSTTKYLKLSYPTADLQGKSMRPSSIISRIKKIFPRVKEYSDIMTGDTYQDSLDKITLPIPTFNQLISAIRRESEGASVNPIWKEVYKWYSENSSWEEKCQIIKAGLNHTNQVSHMGSSTVAKLYGSPIFTSISRMESYFTCPFAYFVQYGLRAKERKLYNLAPLDIGTLIHMVIDRFSNQLQKEKLTWRNLDNEKCYTQVSLIIDELMEERPLSVFSNSKRHLFLMERLKEIIARAVMIIAQHISKGNFEPIGYEVAFGEGETFPPVLLEMPSGEKVYLTGKIDRVDLMSNEESNYIRIIDYKSGNKAFNLSDAYYGLQLQLIAYMDAIITQPEKISGGISNFDSDKPLLPGGILYFRINDPIVKAGRNQSIEEIEHSIMKQLRMKGLLLADVNLVKEMDRDIDGDSIIIPARINKGDVLGRSSAATASQFDLLRKHTRKMLVEMAEELTQGNIAINPYKKKAITSCTYCKFASICQFDPSLKDNKFRMLSEMDGEEVWRLLGGETEDV